MINHPVFRLIFAQLLVALVISVVCAAISGLCAGYSAMLGGTIILVSNSWTYWRLLSQRAQSLPSATHTLQRYYRAEAGKFLWLLLVLVALLKPEQPLAWLGWELNKPFLILGFVVAAILAAVPGARMMSRYYVSMHDDAVPVEQASKQS